MLFSLLSLWERRAGEVRASEATPLRYSAIPPARGDGKERP